MPERIRSVVFDAGNVFVFFDGKKTKEDVIKTLGVTETELNQLWKELIPRLGSGEITEDQFWQYFCKKTGTKKKLPLESLLSREYEKGVRVDTRVLDIVKALKGQGLVVGIMSNTIGPHADINNKHGVYKDFSVRALSHEVGSRKPDDKIYLFTLEALGLPPQAVVLVDDLQENIDKAEALGMRGILYENPEQLVNELAKYNIYIGLVL